jgi:hypothetical protein
MDEISVLIAEDLDLDMLGAGDVALEENLGAAESGAGFALGFFEFADEFFGLEHNAHSAPATAEAGFDDERKSDVFCSGFDFGRLGEGFIGAGDGWNIRFPGEFFRFSFVAESSEQIRRWSDESDSGIDARLGKGSVFGEESVTRMDRIHAVNFGDLHQRGDIQIRFDRLAALERSDQIRFIGFESVEGKPIFITVNGDGAESEFGGGTEDPNRYFTTIGNKQLTHWGSIAEFGSQNKLGFWGLNRKRLNHEGTKTRSGFRGSNGL